MAKTMRSKEAAEKWSCTQAEVTQWCREGKIPGARKEGNQWQIPADAAKPETAAAKGAIGNPPEPSAGAVQPSRRSGLSIAAGLLLLVAAFLPPDPDALINPQWIAAFAGPLKLVQLLLSIAIAGLLFLGRSGNVLTIVLGVKLLVSLVTEPVDAISQLPPMLMLVLRLPYLRREFARVWAIPFALGAAAVTMGTFSPELAPVFSSPYHCFDVWGYLFMGAWLAHPEMTFRSLFFRNINDLDRVSSTIGAIFLRGVAIYGSVITVILFVCILAADSGALPRSILVPLLLVDMPCIGGVANVCIKFQAGRRATKEVRRSINQVNARSGIRGVSERAQAELDREAGKQAQKEVIKGAIVGGMIAGDAGAVVGAMSAKAKQDAASGGASPADSKAASKEVIKGAVVGGILAGDAGAVVGAAAAKAGQKAQNHPDQTK